MNGSPSSDGSDEFRSCQQSIATINTNNNDEESNILKATDVVPSQDSDAFSASPEQPIFTQAPAQSFSDEDDENDSDAFHTAAGSMNQDWQQSSPPATQESQPEESEVGESDESRSEASPEKSVTSTATSTPDSDSTRRGNAAAGWVRPDLLSAITTNAGRTEKRSSVESVVEEMKASDSPSPARGWPALEGLGTQQSATHSDVSSSSPESNVQMDENGSPQQYSPSYFLKQYPASADDEGPIVDGKPVASPGESLSSQSTSANSRMPAMPQHESPTNSQDSGDFMGTAIDSSPEQEQNRWPCSQTTPQQDSPVAKQSDNEPSSCEDSNATVKRDLTRDERIQRNKDRLVSLGLARREPSATPMSMHSSPGETFDNAKSPTGMLLSSSGSSKSEECQPQDGTGSIDALYERYPHRQAQIKLLVSLIGTTMGQTACQGTDPFVPPPIFVSGPSGSGKSSVVRDTVETLRQYYLSSPLHSLHSRAIRTAYVNCAAVEPASLEAVLESAYSQLAPPQEMSSRRPGYAKQFKKKRKKDESTLEGEPNEKRLKVDTNGAALDEPLPSEDVEMFAPSNDGEQYNSGNESEMEDMLEASKTQVERDENKGANATFDAPVRRKTRHSMNGSNDRNRRLSGTNVPNNARKKTIKKAESVTKSHGAPVAFGRVIAPLFSSSASLFPENKPGSAFLILDHAERLFTLSTSQKPEPNNFLAQLLLLPQVMGLNLTIVVVSRNILLDSSRINNSASVQKALGTITNGIRPVRVHFPAYRGAEFKTILKQRNVVELIVGGESFGNESSHDPRQMFLESATDSFIETVVQSLSSVTRDSREVIRVGRSLWPTYILPLDPQNIRTTLATARRRRASRTRTGAVESLLVGEANTAKSENIEDLQKEILSILDEVILPRMKKCLEQELFVMKGVDSHSCTESTTPSTRDGASSRHDLSFLSRCLLLAAFVCQSNKPDKDKALFTIQKNGRKNNRHGHRVGNNESEGLAFGSTTWEQQRLKMLRPRTFPLERMLSVFVNIVGLIGGEEKLRSSNVTSDTGDILSSIGSTCFFDNLARLRDIGLLHEVQGPTIGSGDGYSSFDGVNMISTKYWCELSREEAEEMAASVDFPLANFLL